MRCEDVRAALEWFVLGDLPEADRSEIEAHLWACPDCRAAERRCRELVEGLRAGSGSMAPRPEFGATLRETLGAAIASERRRARVRRVAAALAALAAAVIVAVGVWAGRRAGSASAAPRVDATERWRYAHAQAVPASGADGVVVHGETMYLLREDDGRSRVAAVDVTTGAPRWESPAESLGYLAADDSRVYCLASPRRDTVELVALDADGGEPVWRYAQERASRLLAPSRPLPVAQGRVCWSAGRTVHVLGGATGEPVWRRPLLRGKGALSRAVASGDRLYVTSGTVLHCIAAATGEELWAVRFAETAGAGRPLLALDARRAYVFRTRRPTGRDLLCIDLAARARLWRRDAPETRCLLAAGGVVYLRGGPVAALDGESGRRLWTHPASGCGPLTYIDGLLHVVDSRQRGRLVALDPRTGRPAWELPGIQSCDAFAKVGRVGYIKTRDGVVLALALGGHRRF